MSGKTAASSSQVQIPPEVMAQYRAVNSKADQAASQPFQKYSDSPDAFVAPMTGTQVAGQQGINNAQGMYQPSFDAARALYGQSQGMYGSALSQEQGYQSAAGGLNNNALDQEQGYQNAAGVRTNSALTTGQGFTGQAKNFALAGAQSVDPTALGAAQIGQYMSPYNQAVVQSTMANLRQQQGQEQSSLQGDQIMRGSFGGSRAQLGRANLARQQDLASGQVLSGLENQNYSQALGAAQQQQGVGLGAAQANRAAVQQTGQSLANLGQQAYGQEMGNAQELASLGAQGQAAIGSTADRAAQLGQMGFSAISQAGQNMQGLGAANTALGTGATQNELALRQAQMGAGTVEQQTQQAGLQAQYNQFLQQQGYPFQTAQFLAGIAGITGPNSGSATYSTQPIGVFGSVLSDRRAKTDIEPIGETYDGQKIMRYRYKGRPEKQIGLIAQDVEKRHPLAVRKDHGVRFVDYGRATEDAAERGHFAEGGSAMDGLDFGEILRMHGAMYPYGAEYGHPHTGGGTGPHGMALLQAKPAKLLQVDAPKIKEDNSLHDFANTARDVETISDAGNNLYKKYSDSHGSGTIAGDSGTQPVIDDNGSPTDPDDTKPLARGGMALGRAHFKQGGSDPLPYKGDQDYVPDDILDEQSDEMQKLHDSKAPDVGKMQLNGGLRDLADTMKAFSSFVPGGGSNRGGRIRKALAGAAVGAGGLGTADSDFQDELATDETKNNAIDFVMSQEGDWNPSEKSKYGINQRAHPEIEDVSKLTPADARDIYESKYWNAINGNEISKKNPKLATAAFDTAVLAGPGTAKRMLAQSNGDPNAFLDQREKYLRSLPNYEQNKGGWEKRNTALRDLQDPGVAGLAPPIGPTQQVGYAPEAHPLWDDDHPSAADRAPQPALGGAAPSSTPQPELGGAVPDREATPRRPSPEQKGAKDGNWFDRNRSWLIPVLKGVGTMATSNSRYLLPAMLQGVGAGAGSYMQQQQAEAGLAKTQAGTQQTKAVTEGVQIGNFQRSLQEIMPGVKVVWLADGTPMALNQYMAMKSAGKEMPLLGSIPPDAKDRVRDYIKRSGGHLPGDKNGPAVDASVGNGGDSPSAASAQPVVPPAGGAPAPGPGGAGAPSPPGAPTSTVGSFGTTGELKASPGVVYDDKSREAAKRDAALFTAPGLEREQVIANGNMYNGRVFSAARAAQNSTPLLDELASTIAKSNLSGGAAVPGAGASLRGQLINVANTLSHAVGGKETISDADSNDVIANKIQTVLAGQQASDGGQEAFAALDAIRRNIPNLNMPPKASAELMAQLLMLNQKQIDRDSHREMYSHDSNGITGRASADFDRPENLKRYDFEKQILSHLIEKRPKVFNEMMNGNVSSAHISEYLKDRYGPGAPADEIARYFHPRG